MADAPKPYGRHFEPSLVGCFIWQSVCRLWFKHAVKKANGHALFGFAFRRALTILSNLAVAAFTHPVDVRGKQPARFPCAFPHATQVSLRFLGIAYPHHIVAVNTNGPALSGKSPPSCDSNLVEIPLGVACEHPPCGREGERACNAWERVPSCDAGLVENSGRCALATPCSGEGQRPCKLWEKPPPSCQPNLVERPLGVMCVHPSCGREGERACIVSERIPSCDVGLTEAGGRCIDLSCGAEGHRPCTLIERIPSCDGGLIVQPLGISCVHPPCGRLNERACLITERIPSCDVDLIESAGRCMSASPCELSDAKVVAKPPINTLPPRSQGFTATRTGIASVRLEWLLSLQGPPILEIRRDGNRIGLVNGSMPIRLPQVCLS